ncbi:MAG: hypothetical protein ABW098_13240 [Candidatus Thiodiazotropha sp.]
MSRVLLLIQPCNRPVVKDDHGNETQDYQGAGEVRKEVISSRFSDEV